MSTTNSPATSVIRPGILVALRTSVTGGITYNRVDLTNKEELDNGAVAEKWETTKIIMDKAELERATKARSAAVAEITKVCVRTSFGLLAPAASEALLDEAHAKARALVAEYNQGATHTKVEIHLLKGRIASTDEEAARAIAAEVSGLLRDMDRGVAKLDPEAIRAAATKAAAMGAVLDEAKQAAVGRAVEAARAAARQIVKRVQKLGEDGARVLMDLQTGEIEKARVAFLDLDTPGANDATTDEMPAVALQRSADLDLDMDAPGAPEVASEPPASAPPVAALDFDDAPAAAPVVEAAPVAIEVPVVEPAPVNDETTDDLSELEVFNAM